MASIEEETGVPENAKKESKSLQANLVHSDGAETFSLVSQTSRHDRCWIVGRQAATADLRIQHKNISRKHAVLYFVNDKLYVKDLGGKHGTIVNQQAIKDATELVRGDLLSFGNVATYQVNIAFTDEKRIQQAAEGLSGRAKREAEINAMMESLDETPSYHHLLPQQSPPVDDDIDARNSIRESSIAKDLKLPVTHRHVLHAASSQDSRRHAVMSLAVDPSGSRFVVGSTDSHLYLYDFGGGGHFRTITPQEGHLPVSCVFSNTGDRILVGTTSVQPTVLDREGEEIIEFARGDMYVTDQAKTVGHTAAVTCVDWHPLERDIVLTSSKDGSARLWNLNGKTQFEMLLCTKVFQAKNAKGQRTGVTSVCFHPGGREFALGTACGSIQVWNRDRLSARPERAVYAAHGDNNPVYSIAYNVDGSWLASRSKDDDGVKVWNAQRLGKSSLPLVVCNEAGSIHEQSNVTFSPNGKILCVGASRVQKVDGKLQESGRVNFYDLSNLSNSMPMTSTMDPIFHVDMESRSGPVITKWHGKLNQIFVGCSDGGIRVFFDPIWSKNGALLLSSKAVKMGDGLLDLLKTRASNEMTAVSGEIVAPFQSSLSDDKRVLVGDRKRKQQESKSREPERPASGKHKAGAQAGGSISFAQFVADQRVKKTKAIAGKDPREALLQYDRETKIDEDTKHGS